ncbi:formylglycine-generating enzyme required for sulfatase activity [Anseongella ginsenosidimutans]|uniref:Formylglycine-generating enzyme required for sulfatase activity n=1 Tax=Anseongella ginsenosidimutans TaxID=496056 RepID=A0A4V2UU63_9SPHI|nr:SUMF1/EgtB/PvdO family nonheme iron enzyme [Anseongella ginsenosidimutans]QEC51869.1 formylglycine-generating enzyme family protein [Anseongella ginsenosidimutans]TCS89253.1 formylglycine-generating enzyme required for sulfatase activity [Anseongella ginsenosidimutans]
MNIRKSIPAFILTICFLIFFQPPAAFSQAGEFDPYTQDLANVKTGIDMVPIQAGEFTMGSPADEPGRKPDEGPAIQVKLDPFWMSAKEIPWDVYELFIFESGDVTKPVDEAAGADAVTRPTPPYLDMTFGMGKEGHPAVGMTQYNAIQFCKWLYTRTGVFYRLPTEAEWEYACRAGSASAYFFGQEASALDEYAWYAANSSGETHPVGSKKPNPWGLYDMYGNASEWTIDQYVPDFYKQAGKKTVENPVAEATELYPHSVRGGSFEDEAAELRSANRQKSDPSWKAMDPQTPKSNWWFPSTPFIGVRIVRPLNPPSKEEIAAYYNVEPIPEY